MKINTPKESGRSMLEMILVIVIIIILGVGALMGYRQITARHKASSLYEDIMIQADSMRGKNAQGKPYDSGIGNKTRLGLNMTTNKDAKETFSVIVNSVSVDFCAPLKNKDWKDALRVKIGENAYKPTEMNCNNLEESFKLEVIFPYTSTAIDTYSRTCTDGCLSCEKCDSSGNICINDCSENGLKCINNECIAE